MVSRRLELSPVRFQRGITIVFVTAGMVALLLMVGLALDVGHATLNKTRLQNATDAAALAAAKALDSTQSTVIATTEALIAFNSNAISSGDQELAAAYANGNGTVKVATQYSATLPPFTAGAPKGPYVRVTATGFTRPTWFAQLAGITQMTVAATAVAGPSPTINNACNIVPLLVCGTPGAPNFGYTIDQPWVLKQSAPGNPSAIGPGNFQLIQLGGPGADIVRQNLAGSYSGCATAGNTVQTQTGNEAGPTTQGINTRFGDYTGPLGGTQAQYPPDVLVTEQSPPLTVGSGGPPYPVVGNITYGYQKYVADEGNPSAYNYPPPTGVFNRRVLQVPVGDCSGTSSGSTTVPVIGLACFFLLQKEIQQGISSYIIGEFEGDCTVKGTPGPAPGSGPGPYIIQLYHDPSSGDS
ncbi:MAG: pilus assembly protein [Steroidobacteraceae bacterium]